jgi:hypothetical protein
MPIYHNTVAIDDMRDVTETLLKFCREHGYPEGGLASVDACAQALAANDVSSAVRHFRAVPLGGMGCFNDWIPETVYQHETKQSVCTTFDALLERWSRLMRAVAGASA